MFLISFDKTTWQELSWGKYLDSCNRTIRHTALLELVSLRYNLSWAGVSTMVSTMVYTLHIGPMRLQWMRGNQETVLNKESVRQDDEHPPNQLIYIEYHCFYNFLQIFTNIFSFPHICRQEWFLIWNLLDFMRVYNVFLFSWCLMPGDMRDCVLKGWDGRINILCLHSSSYLRVEEEEEAG